MSTGRRTITQKLLRPRVVSIYSAAPMANYKMKSNSGAKKRFKLTAKGRVKRKRANLRHNLTSKSPEQKRRLRKGGYIAKSQEHQIKVLLPYG